ncbi:MAG: hypothetical protein ABEI74_01245 [Candidatus Pacearchaeota archaeon]
MVFTKNKSGQAAVIGLIVIVLVAVGIIIFSGGGGSPEASGSSTGSSGNSGSGSKSTHTIKMTSGGFSPSTLSIDKGDTVVFKNTGGSPVWPAINRHPTHTQYDGTSTSEHCSDGAGQDTLDACKGVRPGNTYKFTFDKTGSWSFHDHLAPANGGTITVE